jgi:hypothetical protein
MGGAEEKVLERVWKALENYGLLLVSDPHLPSVAGLVAGSPVRGSWWGHRQAHLIFTVLSKLSNHRDVLVAKLVSGKVTLVHRRLWPAVVAVGSAQEPWQLERLSRRGRSLLARVTRQGEVRTDQPRSFPGVGDAARALEQKLLVYAEQVHTNSGAHAKRLETWERWAGRVDVGGIADNARGGQEET